MRHLTRYYQHRLRWLNLPTGLLIVLLQRAPLLRVAATAEEFVLASPAGSLLKSALAAAASLGAVQTLAGATQFVVQPSNPLLGTVSQSFQGAFTYTGTPTPPASFTVSGTLPPGLTIPGLSNGVVNSGQPAIIGTPTQAGDFTIFVQGFNSSDGTGMTDGAQQSIAFIISGGSAQIAPSITTQPQSQSVGVGGSATFTVVATGSAPLSYQWRKDGQNIAGATSATLSLPNVQSANAGSYTVVVTNSAGSATSNAATLTIAAAGGPLTITTQPATQHGNAGASVTFTVGASGGAGALTYQWKKGAPDNTPTLTTIAGATGSAYTISGAQAGDMGFYFCTVTAAGTSVDSSAAILTVNTGGVSRLVNLSTRGLVQSGSALTPGFIMRGTGSKNLIIRGIGPTLAQFGLAALGDSQLQVINQDNGQQVAGASNDDWDSALTDAFGAVGAFPLTAGSKDAAVQASLTVNQGGYTVRITPSGTATSGIALAEVYDAGALTASARLINVSTLGFVGTGEQALVPAFVIGGTGPKQLLIRAIGPGIAAPPFNVPGTLNDPQLSIIPLNKDLTVASNDNWGGTAALKAAFGSAGAFGIDDSSKDAAVVVRLPPGGYTVTVSGVGNTTGTVIAEVYDLDP